jgi:pimeloyl-ACP methyl ester carboxylesterase
VLDHYKVTDVIILGWSMGGHVALELISVLAADSQPASKNIRGILISGTPPVPRQQITGFKQGGVDISALFNPDASREELIKTAYPIIKTRPMPQWVFDDILRTDRLAGRTMVAKFMEGLCSDQIDLIHQFQGNWIAIVNGAEEPMLDLDHTDEMCADAPRLWQGKCIRLEGQGHAGLFDEPEAFATVFSDFVADCST